MGEEGLGWKDWNKIVEAKEASLEMIEANEKRYETFNSVRRTIDAALFLGIPEDTIRDVFDRRGKKLKWESNLPEQNICE